MRLRGTVVFLSGGAILGWFWVRRRRKLSIDLYRSAMAEAIREACHHSLRQRIRRLVESKVPKKLREQHHEEGIHCTLSVSGGGQKNLYALGALCACEDLNVTITHATGASTGSWTACAAVTHKIDKLLELSVASYMVLSRHGTAVLWDMASVFEHFLLLLFPPSSGAQADISTVCPKDDHMFITLSEMRLGRGNFFHERIYSKFRGTNDLVECLLSSATIPFFTAPHCGIFTRFRDMFVIDGGILNNTPFTALAGVKADTPMLRIVYPLNKNHELLCFSVDRGEELIMAGAEHLCELIMQVEGCEEKSDEESGQGRTRTKSFAQEYQKELSLKSRLARGDERGQVEFIREPIRLRNKTRVSAAGVPGVTYWLEPDRWLNDEPFPRFIS